MIDHNPQLTLSTLSRTLWLWIHRQPMMTSKSGFFSCRKKLATVVDGDSLTEAYHVS